MSAQESRNAPDNQSLNQYENEIDLRELFLVLWESKVKIIAITAMFAVASVFYSLSVPDQYKATALLAPAKSDGGGLSGAMGKLGGLASLAGVNIGSGESTEAQVAQEIMRSWSFIEGFIESNNLAIDIYSSVGWDKKSNKLLINDGIYDLVSESWVSEGKPPSSWELYRAFINRVVVSRDKETGWISVAIEHYSPHVAKRWLDLYVAAINEHMQQRKMAKVTRNIEYLEAQIRKTSITEMQEVFYAIIQEQVKTKMLAEASPEYVFVAVSPSMLPEEKSQPNRGVMCIFGTLLGGMLSVIMVLVMHYARKSD